MEQSRQQVSDLHDQDAVAEVYLCARKAVPVDRTGRRYLHMTLADRSGEIEALLWEEAERQAAGFAAGDLVQVKGTAVLFHGRLQLHLTEVHRADRAAVSPEELTRRGTEDPERLWTELRSLLATVQEPHLARLLGRLVDDEALVARLKESPAAKSIHHAYLGGLLEHTLSVVRLTEAMCTHYRQAAPGLLNRDLCVTGAFVHDLGKLDEISSAPGFQYTDRGRLLGHIVLGLELLDRVLGALEGFPAALADHLRHIVVSHHGEREHGSPKRPKTAEAFVVHRADELDAHLISLRDVLGPPGVPGWTPYVPLYDRYLWRGWPSGEGEPPGK